MHEQPIATQKENDMDKDKVKLYGAIGVIALAFGFLGYWFLLGGNKGSAPAQGTSGGIATTEEAPPETDQSGAPIETLPPVENDPRYFGGGSD
jgi:hypothetical protein